MFVEAIPRLQAREALVLTCAVAIGTGSMRKERADQTMREWQKAAQGPRVKAQKEKNRADFMNRIRSLGIAVVTVPKRKPTDG